MGFVGTIWKVLVGIKDGLVLVFMLLFFILLFAALSARPSPGSVRDGALLIDLSGSIVEERTPIDPVRALISGEAPVGEHQARDIVRALDGAASDARIKAVVLDLTTFLGGGQVHLAAIGEAMDRVRAAKKPVLTYGLAYGDDHLRLASHASEVWVDPLGGALVTGPGGTFLFYGDLLKRLGIEAHIFRAGDFKSATEPYSGNAFSDAAKADFAALYGALWAEWQASVAKARPKAKLAEVTTDPVGWIERGGGDLAQASLAAGLVDKLGDRAAFGARVAEIAGKDPKDKKPGAFAHTELEPFLAALPDETPGKAIGVITIAGDIVDGEAGPGTAGGTRIADLLDEALDDELAALVVRVDSPGGSVTASEEIHRAILRHRQKGIPVAVSFANVAASGGYWIATAGERIFAEPETITGSIGVFLVLPSFEQAAAKVGLGADGFRSTPLSGQPDLVAGFSPEVEALLQAGVSSTYSDFLKRVGEARKMSLERVEGLASGRVFDGGTARQNGLVDQFGGLDDALAWAAGKAKLPKDGWHPVFLGEETGGYDPLIRKLLKGSGAGMGAGMGAVPGHPLVQAAQQQSRRSGQMLSRAAWLLAEPKLQAYCLECPPVRAGAGVASGPAAAGLRAGAHWRALLGLLEAQ